MHTQRACPEPPDNVRMHASTVLQQRRVVGNMRRVRGHPAPGLTDQPPSVARLARGATGQVAASLPDSTNFYLRKFRCLAWPGQRVRWPWLTMHEANFQGASFLCNHHFAQQEHLLFKIIQSLLKGWVKGGQRRPQSQFFFLKQPLNKNPIKAQHYTFSLGKHQLFKSDQCFWRAMY